MAPQPGAAREDAADTPNAVCRRQALDEVLRRRTTATTRGDDEEDPRPGRDSDRQLQPRAEPLDLALHPGHASNVPNRRRGASADATTTAHPRDVRRRRRPRAARRQPTASHRPQRPTSVPSPPTPTREPAMTASSPPLPRPSPQSPAVRPIAARAVGRHQGLRQGRQPPSAPSTASTSSSTPAGSPPSWARPAPASRRSCTPSPGSTSSPTARSSSATSTSPRLNDKKLTQLRRDRLGFIFQAFNLVPDAHRPREHHPPDGPGRPQGRPAWLDLVVDHRRPREPLKHRPSELSGGQQQRVAVARALAAGRRSSSPTSPPATSTAAPAPRSSPSCARPCASSARPS